MLDAGSSWYAAFSPSARTSHSPGTPCVVRAKRSRGWHSHVLPRVALLLRSSRTDASCARVLQNVESHRGLHPSDGPRSEYCKRNGLNSLRCAGERGSNARPLSVTHTPHTNPVKHHELTVRLIPCAMQASGPTGWACVTGVWHAHTAAVARVWACGVRAEVACVRPPPRGAAARWREEGARERHVDCQGGCPASLGAQYAS